MSNSEPQTPPIHLERIHSPLGALLSYLVPGLGQIYQGRVTKGLLFLVCLLGMFFFGMYLGNWNNVYLPQNQTHYLLNRPFGLPLEMKGPLAARLHYAGQFWVGVAAWPAMWQYAHYRPEDADKGLPLLGTFQRQPDELELDRQMRDNDKTPDLAWVYTVIAGVLNILVIYDAFAGPAFGASAVSEAPGPKQDAARNSPEPKQEAAAV
jgi:hypothetical protein